MCETFMMIMKNTWHLFFVFSTVAEPWDGMGLLRDAALRGSLPSQAVVVWSICELTAIDQ